MDAGPVALVRALAIGERESAASSAHALWRSSPPTRSPRRSSRSPPARVAGRSRTTRARRSRRSSSARRRGSTGASRPRRSRGACAPSRRARARITLAGRAAAHPRRARRAGPADRTRPGRVRVAGDGALRVATGDGWLVPLVLQRAGGRALDPPRSCAAGRSPTAAQLGAERAAGPTAPLAMSERHASDQTAARPPRGARAPGRRASAGADAHARARAARARARAARRRLRRPAAAREPRAQPALRADRAFATELVYGTLRWRGRIDYLLRRCSIAISTSSSRWSRPRCASAPTRSCFADRVPASAAVDESVRCVRALGAERATGLVNAVLRRLAREHAEMRAARAGRRPARPPDARALAAAVDRSALARDLRRRGGRRAGGGLQRDAAAHACARIRCAAPATRCSPSSRSATPRRARVASRGDGIVLGRRGNPTLDPAFREGRFTVQDEATQLVVELLDPQPGRARARHLRRARRQGHRDRRARRRARAPCWRSTATSAASTWCGAPRAGCGSTTSPAARPTPRARSAELVARAASTACSSTRPAPASARCAAIPTRAGASSPPIPRGSPRSQRAILRSAAARCGPAACSSTVPARCCPRRTRPWSRRFLRESPRLPPAPRRRARPPRCASCSTRAASCARCRTATTPTASSRARIERRA